MTNRVAARRVRRFAGTRNTAGWIRASPLAGSPAEIHHERRAGDGAAVGTEEPRGGGGHFRRLEQPLHGLRREDHVLEHALLGNPVHRGLLGNLCLDEGRAHVTGADRRSGDSRVRALEGADAGISASAICPGYVRTALVEAQIAEQASVHGIPEERVLEDVILAPQAVKRLLEPSEVAAAAAWLLGPDGRSVTGSPLVMDLGWTAR